MKKQARKISHENHLRALVNAVYALIVEERTHLESGERACCALLNWLNEHLKLDDKKTY